MDLISKLACSSWEMTQLRAQEASAPGKTYLFMLQRDVSEIKRGRGG